MSNLLFPAFNYPPKIGGPATSVPNLARLLANEGYKVDVIAQKFKRYYDDFIEGVEVHRVGHFSRSSNDNSTLGYVSTIPFMANKIRKIVKKKNPIAIHCHDISVSPLSAISARKISKFKNPIISKYTGDIALEYSLKKSHIPAKDIIDEKGKKKTALKGSHAKALERLQNYVIKNSNFIACPGEFQKEVLLERGIEKEKLVVLKNAIETDLFRPFEATRIDDKFRIAFFGRLVKWKGVYTMLEAIKELHQQIPELELEIIGDGPEKQNMQETVLRLGLQDIVKFEGKLDNPMIPKRLAYIDIVLVPSFYDPYPHTVLEAMACGKAIIASSVGGITEQIEHGKTGLLVKPFNSGEIIDSVLALYFHKEEIKKIGKRAAKFAATNFSWNEVLNYYLKFYEGLE